MCRAVTSSPVPGRPAGPVPQKLLSPSTWGVSDSAGAGGVRAGLAVLCLLQTRAPSAALRHQQGPSRLRPAECTLSGGLTPTPATAPRRKLASFALTAGTD